MPKRSDRQYFSESFGRNPYESEDLQDMYKRLRWGNKPNRKYPFNAPEPMVTIGEVAKIRCKNGDLCNFEEEYGPYLAVGRNSNLLYVVPKHPDSRPFDVPDDNYRFVTKIIGIDYFSDKGGEMVYYYHDHEAPYPSLMQHPKGVCFIQPAITEDGLRSYAVDDAGIIG